MSKRSHLEQLLVIDVESTCWEGEAPPDQTSEIIEIGVCVVDVPTLSRLQKRSILVKPARSQISEFCSKLTTLKPDDFNEAISFSDALRILKKEYGSADHPWASWGDYDRVQFERCCAAEGIRYPFGRRHLNVKTLFALAHNTQRELGLEEAYQNLGLTMEGQPHRGHDDAWNIAGILCQMLAGIRLE